MNNKVEEERRIFDLAKPFLENIYGKFETDPDQRDRPDAAIILINDIKIGIEITTIDNEDHLRYWNKHRPREEGNQKIEKMKRGEIPDQPTKKDIVPISSDYIAKGVLNKAKKYDSYSLSGKYNEIIILAHSHCLDISKFPNINSCTSYLLNQKNFPFDKVIFVDTFSKKAKLVFDKKNPVTEKPSEQSQKEILGTTERTCIGPIPMGKKFNIKDLLNKDPEHKK